MGAKQIRKTVKRQELLFKVFCYGPSPLWLSLSGLNQENPPRQRLCVDYWALNKLLPPANKAHSKAKGILTLVPLPKIDEIYAKLAGLSIYSTLDLRSGYYHIALSADPQTKSAFVPPMAKFEFLKVPFGLAQGPCNKIVLCYDNNA